MPPRANIARTPFRVKPDNSEFEGPLDDCNAAIIVPGFLSGSSDFLPLAKLLTARGIPTTVLPMPVWHWLPCLGGRSMRPMLERIDNAVRHLSAAGGDVSAVPRVGYSLADLWSDFRANPGGVFEVGGSSEPDEYPLVEPCGTFLPPPAPPKARVALVGHSAGGWISRVYLSSRSYAGKAYGGARLVHSLVTLGTPHGDAPGPAFKGVAWCNREAKPQGVRCLAVAAKGTPGDRSGALTQSSYAFCVEGSDGSDLDGDGLTPVQSALAFPGAEQLVLDRVTHFPWGDVFGGDVLAPELAMDYKAGMPWYGSENVVDKWAGWLSGEEL
eukprot:CAMPEP_0172646640 /NCGR_PEP_ID=MMETSP1068-20121228/240345_1 /TAXON_ID=35684 /ORGANISM="Pseudopedinella elastica, Strain CCMP716" /LENGTH=326 /DNA_ID=CAMNT_0013460905 /DNA_START=1411 /DNA_END=2391 /DNA_ORIENTATION=-